MSQIRFPLGIYHQTPLGQLTALPRPSSCIYKGPTSKGREEWRLGSEALL